MKIKKEDTVKILSGKEKGKTGKVIRVVPAEARVMVEGLNLHKKHVRSRQAERKGEIVFKPGFLAAAKVMLICPQCGKAARIGYERADAKNKRVCKKCHQYV